MKKNYNKFFLFLAILITCQLKSLANILPANLRVDDSIFENGLLDSADSTSNFTETEPSISAPIFTAPQADCRSFITVESHCDSKTLSLRAWVEISNPPAAPVVQPFTGLWSTGQFEQIIEVTPPGAWSIETPGCAWPNDVAFYSDTRSFFNGPLVIEGPEVLCGSPIEIYLGTNYPFTAFDWGPPNPRGILSPYEVTLPGNYFLNVVDQFGCNFNDAKVVVQSPPVLPVISGTKNLCFGQTGNLTVNPPSSQYQWENGQTTQSISIDASGLYFVTITNALGCTGTSFYNVNAAPEIDEIVNFISPPQICADGTAIVLASIGGAGTFVWSTGATTPNILVNQPGDYLVTATNSFGCTKTETINVPAATPPVPVLNSPAFCPGFSATLAVSGGDFNMWTWSTGQNSPTITVNTAGTYTVVVRDANGCKGTATATVTAAPAAVPTVSAAPYACNGQISLSANAGFTSYQWSNGQTTPTISAQSSGNYTVTVVNSAGCTGIASQNVNIPPAPATQISGVNSLCANVSGQLSASGGYPNYAWSNGQTGANITVNSHGNYTVTATDQFGCTATATHIVSLNVGIPPQVATLQNVSCFGQNNGSAMATGNGGNGIFNYQWSNGATSQTISNLPAGTYSVVVTDGNGCTTSGSATISQPTVLVLNASATAESFNNGNNGTASATGSGGTQNYNFLWSNGATSATISNLAPGSYSVTLTDANGCTASQSVFVNKYNCTFSNFDLNEENVSCFGANDGVASILVSGGVAPLTYSWSNGGSGASIQNLSPGQYTVNVFDANECTAQFVLNITQPTILTVATTATNASGNNSNNGTATATAGGGTAGYTFLWSNGQSGASIQNLAAGFYTVTATDLNGCTAVSTVEVGVDCALTASIDLNEPTCFGFADGSVSIAVSGGPSPYVIFWTDGQNPVNSLALPAGNYFVTATDANGCQITMTATLGQPAQLLLSAIATTPTSCANDSTGTATVAASGGTGNVNFLWENGQSSTTANGLGAGQISVVATDQNGCSTTAETTILVNDLVPPTITVADLVLPLGPAGSVVLTQQNTNSSFSDNCGLPSFSFSPPSFNCSQQGDHVVVVTATDGNNNSATAQFSIKVIDNSAPEMDCPANIVRCAGDDVVSYTAPSVEDNCQTTGGQFSFDEGLPSGSQFPVGTTLNVYSFTDAAGNVGKCSFTVTVLQPLSATATVVNDIDNQMIGSINITVAGGQQPYSFTWKKDGQQFATTEDLTNIGSGAYTVQVVDASGCTLAAQAFEIKNTVAANEPSWGKKFQLLPNPSNGLLTAIFPNDLAGEATALVFDETGRLVFSKNFEVAEKIKFDLTGLPSGFYNFSIRLAGEILSRKVVIER